MPLIVALTLLASADGHAIYTAACAACHGPDGRGQPQSVVAFEEEIPDFTQCSFATREPHADWVGVAYEGGPTRGFSRMMPAFGQALSEEELALAVGHVRTFCEDDEDWPRGDLNLPRAMFTEKAFVEDEAVIETAIGTEGTGAVVSQLIYETRVGNAGQVELVVPFGWREQEVDGPWVGGIGDIAVGGKYAAIFNRSTGTVFSLAAEVILPTGNKRQGFGKGSVVFEPFLAFGQLLPADFFLHAQVGAEIPVEKNLHNELFWRAALGKTFTVGKFGAAISPIVEVLGKRELEEGASIEWDLVPQVQVPLNTRQHILANVAVRVPLSGNDHAPTEVLLYLLWDWFDGGLTEGW